MPHTTSQILSTSKKKLFDVFRHPLFGAIGVVVIGALASLYILPGRPFEASTKVVCDSSYATQGNHSIKWEYSLQPKQQHLFDENIVGGYAHIEVRPNADGELVGLDLSAGAGIRFRVKASEEFLKLDEFNLFIDTGYLQYISDTKPAFKFKTRWETYDILFDSLTIAPWDRKDRAHLWDGELKPSKSVLSKVTAFGWDVKAVGDRRVNRIWLDEIFLIDSGGNVLSVITNAETQKDTLQGKQIHWVSDWIKLRPWEGPWWWPW
jgi:hypothetical protein